MPNNKEPKRYVVQYWPVFFLKPQHNGKAVIWETNRLQSALAIWSRAMRKGYPVGSLQGVYDRETKQFIAPSSKSKKGRHL